jgi:hypothetical protein
MARCVFGEASARAYHNPNSERDDPMNGIFKVEHFHSSIARPNLHSTHSHLHQQISLAEALGLAEISVSLFIIIGVHLI